MDNSLRRVHFQFTKDPEYRVVYANGAFGGPTPRGDIKFDLFIEYGGSPEEVVHSMTPDGLGPEVERSPEQMPFVRESQIGVIMSLGQAKSFGHWLLSKVSEVENKNR